MISANKSLVVIGSTGQLGQQFLQVLGHCAVGLSHQDVDVLDVSRLTLLLGELRPDWVINTSAFHKVNDCELNPDLAFSVNAIGALNVARVSAALGAGVVHFSTDYVYGRQSRLRGMPYLEPDVAEPINIYGSSKLAGESLVAQANSRHLVLRTASLYGSFCSHKGWTFPEFMIRKARENGIVRVVTDQIMSPTFTSDLAQKTLELMEVGATGLFHLVNEGECSWFDFAGNVLRLARVTATIEPVTSASMPNNACRPNYSALASGRLKDFDVRALRPWQEALYDYVQMIRNE